MSLFLDNHINNVHNEYQDCIIHSYNKHCFTNYTEAYNMLLNKVLLPGEIAIAYYYDTLSPYGQNAIIAAGPLTQGSGNIIFKNAECIDNIETKLLECIADINTSINYLRSDLYDDLNNTVNDVNTSLIKVLDEVEGPLNVYCTSINALEISLKHNVKDIKDNIESSYITLNDYITNESTKLSTIINNVSNNTVRLIYDTSAYVISYVNDLLEDSFSQIDLSTGITNTTNKIANTINTFRSELEQRIDNTSTNINSHITNIYRNIDNLNTSINYNTNRINDIDHKIAHIIDLNTIDNLYTTNIDSLNNEITTFKDNITSKVDNIIEDINLLDNKYNSKIDLLNVSVNTVYDNLNSLLTEFNEIRDKVNNELTTNVEQLTTSLGSTVRDVIVLNSKILLNDSSINSLHRNINEYTQIVNSSIYELSKKVLNFSNDMNDKCTDVFNSINSSYIDVNNSIQNILNRLSKLESNNTTTTIAPSVDHGDEDEFPENETTPDDEDHEGEEPGGGTK